MSTVQQRIESKLRRGIEPLHLSVVNESGMHAVPPGSETHFRVLVVSEAFAGASRVVRHRTVHSLVAEELTGGLHALAIDAWTPEEWERNGAPSVSPACRGGDGGRRARGDQ
ncbi:MAG TPA: BolA family protein [Thermoanaerobaculia bacterium]|nr:BolA family protein [Thermoanaerobaculia bacterium]